MKFLLPYFDDSSLIFAAKMRNSMSLRGHDALVAQTSAVDLSDRQVSSHLPQGPDMSIEDNFFQSSAIKSFDGVITCKAPISLRKLMASGAHKRTMDRPAYIAFQPGLEFTPDRGRKNRVNFDIVFLYSAEHRDLYKSNIKSRFQQHISFGHPYFIKPNVETVRRKNVYFFAQAISPATLLARRFVVDVLATLAERHPERDVFIKLRHLPNENSSHVHKEVFSYPWILDRYFQNAPSNLKLTDCSIDSALSDAGVAITCTSTAVMDAISAGVPAMIYLDYVENYHDPYSDAMRAEFRDSELIATLSQIMDLEYKAPSLDWMGRHFRGEDLFGEIVDAVLQFKNR